MIKRFRAAPAYMKLLFILGLPLIIVFMGPSILFSIRDWIEERRRKQVDDKSRDLDKKIVKTESDAARTQGRIDQLESEKKKAVKNAGKKDPANFINDRFDPDNK